jgi:DNA mismatch repair protein MLH3
MKQLSAETRAKLRSTQILTSLSSIISELLQNSIDAGASQVDIGVDCSEWSCWVMDNGSGFTKDGLSKIGQDTEYGRYSVFPNQNPSIALRSYFTSQIPRKRTILPHWKLSARLVFEVKVILNRNNVKPVAQIYTFTAALSSMADLCCLEISSRTARSRESWSVIVKVFSPVS